MPKRFLLLAALVAGLTSCQTQYQDMGATGGVTAMPITNDTYRIVARGNGFTDKVTVQDYSLLKAAETTLKTGNTHFLVISGDDATSREVGQTAGSMQTNIIGNTAYTTYNPGVSYDIVKPGQDLIIKLLNAANGPVPPAAYSAKEVYDNVNPRVIRPKRAVS